MSPSKKKPMAVREPVQVYLDRPDKTLLDRVAKRAGLSRAEVLRRGLRSYGAEVLTEDNPILKLLHEFENADWPADVPTDLAVNHDKYLAELYADTHEPKKKR
jgi:hypothetical protein